MTAVSAVTEAPTIERFIDLFLASLVVRNKRYIWIRTPESQQERRRMYALYEHVSTVFEEVRDRESRERIYFLLRLRNHLAPSLSGSFDGLEHSILRNMSTVISVVLPYCEYYRIDLQPVSANCWLEQADPWLRELAQTAADVYMQPLEKENV
ncbi:MAG: hypothetical protein P4L81_03165 [Candidatus Pacebacteria bacterium]|nr:hypothetical protein [Candidatus Paceibacterota bacterium]